MFHSDLFKLNTAVADGLQSVKALKQVVVRARQYEQSARLRDAEKLFEQLAALLNQYEYPFAISSLKPGGTVFYKHLFGYAMANDWHIPDMLTEKFNLRKAKQHVNHIFNQIDVERLINLNNNLLVLEPAIVEFMEFITFGISVKGFNNRLTDGGSVTLKCYTAGTQKALINYGSTGSTPFYQLTFAAHKLLTLDEIYYDTNISLNHAENDFLKPLPLKLREERLCYLFYLLIERSLLAWDDILSIEKIEIYWDARYLAGRL